MRRTQQRWVSFVLDAPSKKLKSTSRQVEHWRTRKMQASRATTNPYHKEQYISAFLEAQSADMVHRHSVEAESTAQAALPTTSTTSTHHNLSALAALAQELETRYATGASSAVSTTGTAALTNTRDSGNKAVKYSPVEFGAWRSAEGGDVRLQHRVRATDVVRHCVIREARTPPELSPEVLQRSLPPQPQPFSVQHLLAYLQSRSFRAATKPVQHDRLQGDAAEALQTMRYAPALQRSLALYCVFALGCHRDWQTSSHFVLWLQGQWTALADVTAAQRSTDAAHFAAVLFDTVRWASPKKSAALLPTLEELDHFCSAYHQMLRGGEDDNAVAGTGEKTGALWDTVVCAPLLSVAGLREEREAPAVSQIDRVEQLVERYCVHLALPASYYHPRKQPKPLAYMPAVAWGEYLRALHRCGADRSTLQAATDRLTDPSRTRQARQLLSSTHVWNAYLACSPGAHAAEVFRKNLKHYRVKATPATTAAVITALLNEETETATAQARVLWDRLCATPPSAQVILRTSSTVVAHARLLAAESNTAALAALLLSYHELYECFGVPRKWFEEQQRESLQEPLRMADGVRLLHCACAAHPLLIPPVVQAALVAAVRKTEERVAAAARALPREQETVEGGVVVSSGRAEAMPELTAEDLAAML